MTEEQKQALIGLCRVEIRRWEAAAEAVPDKKYMVDLMQIALATLTATPVKVDDSMALGISVPEFIEWKLKEAHAEHLLRMGVQNTFEYCVDKHEHDSALALKIIDEHRKEMTRCLGE